MKTLFLSVLLLTSTIGCSTEDSPESSKEVSTNDIEKNLQQGRWELYQYKILTGPQTGKILKPDPMNMTVYQFLSEKSSFPTATDERAKKCYMRANRNGAAVEHFYYYDKPTNTMFGIIWGSVVKSTSTEFVYTMVGGYEYYLRRM